MTDETPIYQPTAKGLAAWDRGTYRHADARPNPVPCFNGEIAALLKRKEWRDAKAAPGTAIFTVEFHIYEPYNPHKREIRYGEDARRQGGTLTVTETVDVIRVTHPSGAVLTLRVVTGEELAENRVRAWIDRDNERLSAAAQTRVEAQHKAEAEKAEAARLAPLHAARREAHYELTALGQAQAAVAALRVKLAAAEAAIPVAETRLIDANQRVAILEKSLGVLKPA